ncbi:hypothetical protein LXL04_001186 [Taraxacum kok-saghyz]
MWTSSERFYPNVNKFGTFLPKCGQDGSGYSKPLPLLFPVVVGNIAGVTSPSWTKAQEKRKARDPPPISLSNSRSRKLRNSRSIKGGGASPAMFPSTTRKRRGSGFEYPEPSCPHLDFESNSS